MVQIEHNISLASDLVWSPIHEALKSQAFIIKCQLMRSWNMRKGNTRSRYLQNILYLIHKRCVKKLDLAKPSEVPLYRWGHYVLKEFEMLTLNQYRSSSLKLHSY